MTDKEILQMKLNLKDSILNEKEKEEFLMKVEQFTDVFRTEESHTKGNGQTQAFRHYL